jgi:hypothetical protein
MMCDITNLVFFELLLNINHVIIDDFFCAFTVSSFKLLQAAFLSALAGTEVAHAAAQAALTTLTDVYKSTRSNYRSFQRNALQQGENDI